MVERLLDRFESIVNDINERRREMGDCNEYTAWFVDRYDILLKTHRRLVYGFGVDSLYVRIEFSRPLRTGVSDGDFSVGHHRGEFYAALLRPRRGHPVLYSNWRLVPPYLASEKGWARRGCRVRDDAVVESVVGPAWDYRFVRRIETELFHKDDTYATPKKLLELDWPKGTGGFVEKLNRHPDDTTTWLVLADWCEENGQEERGQDIRRYWSWREQGIVD